MIDDDDANQTIRVDTIQSETIKGSSRILPRRATITVPAEPELLTKA